MASYDLVEREMAFSAPLDIGEIALATALGWIEFRRLPPCEENRPQIHHAFGQRASMRISLAPNIAHLMNGSELNSSS